MTADLEAKPRRSKKQKLEELRSKRRRNCSSTAEGRAGNKNFDAKESVKDRALVKKPSVKLAKMTNVDRCIRAYQEDPRPRKLGNMYCFWYTKKNVPRIVIGPDWYFSLLQMFIVNGALGSILFVLTK